MTYYPNFTTQHKHDWQPEHDEIGDVVEICSACGRIRSPFKSIITPDPTAPRALSEEELDALSNGWNPNVCHAAEEIRWLRAEGDRLRKEIAEGVRLFDACLRAEAGWLSAIEWWAKRNRPEVQRG